jgi:hypothetical protein
LASSALVLAHYLDFNLALTNSKIYYLFLNYPIDMVDVDFYYFFLLNLYADDNICEARPEKFL